MTGFDPDVYAAIRDGAKRSAAVCAPMILNALPDPQRRPTILDVGCGEGWWSEAFLDLNCAVDSVDQEPPLEQAEGVHIDRVDLEGEYALRRGYDLALCLEVAEHLTPKAGGEIVRQLTRCAGVVAWSAAIPAQGGHGHLNEQWPDYWETRFAAHGWAFLDPFRDALWGHPEVEPWYQQNLLLAAPSGIATSAGAARALVHPAIYLSRAENAAYWREQALESQREVERVRRSAADALS